MAEGKPMEHKLNKSAEKGKQRVERIISKTKKLKEKKQREIQLLDEQEKQLQELLNNIDNLDENSLKQEIKNIELSYKNKMKAFNDHQKRLQRATKGQNKLDKQAKKELNEQRKEQKKLEKAQRQKANKEKQDKLKAAQLQSLPASKKDIGDSSILSIYVDGYNITGCDAICRKNMRGRRGGMRKSRARLSQLLQTNFLNKIKSDEIKLDYNVNMKLWFDGNGKNEQYQDIEITYSTKKQIVDDKLVELFTKNNKKQNSAILVITSDRELTLRLYEIGVKVMKSSTFYKTFLTTNDNKNEKDEEEEEEEKKEIEEETNDDNNDNDVDDNFVGIMAQKLNYSGYSDEGQNDHQYPSPNGDDQDNEFTEIFGEGVGNTPRI